MPNRILDAYVATRHADPAGAELRIIVRPECITPATEIKGRLMGPRSPYANTVEIAYPVREMARTDHVLLRVLIPEPNFWQPQSPLLYEGPLELWQDGARVEQIWLRHGIRTVQLGERGLRVNGQPCKLQGVGAEIFTETDARRWHDEGINLVLMPARDDTIELLQISDRFGLFVLGRIEQPHHWPRWPLACQRHPSYLGCVLTAGVDNVGARLAVPGLLGAEVAADGTAPAGRFDFVVMPSGQPATLMMPTILQVASAEAPPAPSNALLGWVRQSH